MLILLCGVIFYFGMKDENFINIQGWMINRLQLKGNELVLYAIIYGFSQNGESQYRGSISYICKAMSLSNKTVISNLKKLEDKGFIKKTKKATGNNYKIIPSAISAPVKMNNSQENDNITRETPKYSEKTGSAEIALPESCVESTPVKKLHRGYVESTQVSCVETTHNNNNYNNNIIINSKELGETPKPPEKTKSFGDTKINNVLEFFKTNLEIEGFKETVRRQRQIGRHMVSLKEKLGADEFIKRFEYLRNDDFHYQNCGSLDYLYKNIKSYVPKPKAKTSAKSTAMKKQENKISAIAEKKEEAEKVLLGKIEKWRNDPKNAQTLERLEGIVEKKFLEYPESQRRFTNKNALLRIEIKSVL